jgi:VCBS repeat-containing protein
MMSRTRLLLRAAGLAAVLALGGARAAETLVVTDGYDQDGNMAVTVSTVQSSDDGRWQTPAGAYTSFAFSGSVPAGATISSVIIYVEHCEDNGFSAGNLQWSVGTGWPGGTAWQTTAAIPVHAQSKNEAVDSWDVTAWVDTAEKLNTMELRIYNLDARKKTLTDYVYAVVTYSGGNAPPVASDDTYSVDEDATLSVPTPGVLGNDTDAEGDPLTATLVTGPSDGTLTLNANGSFGYTPDPNFTGDDTFTYKANDSTSDSNVATVTITVNPVPDPIHIDGVTVVEPAGGGPVGLYRKLELLVSLTTDVSPGSFYDPDPNTGLDLHATFTSPTGGQTTINGFYDGSSWRIRFAPDDTGNWVIDVEAVDASGSATWSGGFTCTDTGQQGFARIDGHYLRLSTGEALFAVGHNNGWQDGPEGVELPTLADMKSRGENLLSFWLAAPWDLPSWGPERAARSPIENIEQGIGNYNQAACAYIDGVVGRAEAAGVYLLPTIWSHGQLRASGHSWGTGWWDSNAYSTVCSAAEFFQRTDASGDTPQWRLQKNFYRYLIARWGYSRAIAGWVGMCEIDGTTGWVADAAQATSWCAAVRDYFRLNDPFRANAAGDAPIAFTKLNSASWGVGDLRATDNYAQQSSDVNVALAIGGDTETMWTSGNPCFHAEFGGNTSSGASQPAHLHNGVWAGSSAGAAATPLVWCDGGDFPMLTDASVGEDMRSQLEYLAEFMDGISYNGDAALAPATLTVTHNCRAWGMSKGDRGFVWVQNPYGTMGGQTLTISGIAQGSYSVLWYDAWTSGQTPCHIGSASVATEGGDLVVTVPVLARGDIACKFLPGNRPVADAQQVETDEDVPVAITLSATDPDGDYPLTYEIVTPPASGALSGTAPDVTYTPNPDFHGVDSFTFKAVDSTGAASDDTTVTITVISVNDAPVAADDTATTVEDTAVVIDVVANDDDVDGDALSVLSVGDPPNGTAADNGDGTVTYTPDAGFTGSDSFAYDISDGNGGTDTASVTVTVAAVNHAPVANADSYTVDEDATLTVPALLGVLANDTDEDNDDLSAAVVGSTTDGDVTLNSDGSFTYQPNANFNGTDSFTYVASDGTDDSNEATVSITVSAVNDDPVASDDTASTTEGTPVPISVLANDSDVDGDTITVTSVTQGINGTVTINVDDTVTYTPDAGFTGTDSFGYEIGDGNGGVAAAAVTVTVSPSSVPGISGRITDVDGIAVEGIALSLERKDKGWQGAGSATTNSEGYYRFDGLGAGTYKVTPDTAHPTLKFDPRVIEVTLLEGASAVCDFTANRKK